MSPKPQDAPWSDADDLNVCLMHAVVGIRWHLLEHLALGVCVGGWLADLQAMHDVDCRVPEPMQMRMYVR
jgi:hypothetical protein